MEKQAGLVSSAEVADLFGMDVRRVQQLAKTGIITPAKQRPYRFDLRAVTTEYIQYLSDKVQGRERRTSGTTENEKLQAEVDLKRAKADMAGLQLAELEGNMYRSEDVEAVTNDLVYAVRAAVLAMPGRLAMDVIQTENANEAAAIIRKECYKVLESLAGYQFDPDVYKKRIRDRKGWNNPAVELEENDE